MSGRGTAAGIEFQGLVGAVFGNLMLSEKKTSILDDTLVGTPLKLLFEVPEFVDDIKIETENGILFIQAKTSVALSEAGKGDLFSTVLQFVKLYKAGITEGINKRALDDSNDRLILCVPANAPKTITHDLKTILDRNRTDSATGQSEKLTAALNILIEHIKLAWLKTFLCEIPNEDLKKVLTLISIIEIGAAQVGIAKLSTSEMLAKKGEEDSLFNHLKGWAISASTSGTGANGARLRKYLIGLIELEAAPKFKKDIEKLIAYSEASFQRLGRFSSIKTKSGELCLKRDIDTLVTSAAKMGSLLLTGDPGAGKSGVLHAVSKQLKHSGLIIVLSVDPTISSLEELRKEINLENPVLSVFQAISGHQPTYLLIDALDAARGGGRGSNVS